MPDKRKPAQRHATFVLSLVRNSCSGPRTMRRPVYLIVEMPLERWLPWDDDRICPGIGSSRT